MLVDLSVSEFVDQLASGEPTPGGGSASALAGGMGAALVAMFCNLTATRKKYAAVKPKMEAIAAAALTEKARFVELVDKDSAAYNKIVAANRLPKETEEEKAARSEAVEKATEEATLTPLTTVAVAVSLLEKLPSLAGAGNPNALSDLRVGVELLATAIAGAKANVEINLPWLPEKQKKQLGGELADLAARGNSLLTAVRAEISGLEA